MSPWNYKFWNTAGLTLAGILWLGFNTWVKSSMALSYTLCIFSSIHWTILPFIWKLTCLSLSFVSQFPTIRILGVWQFVLILYVLSPFWVKLAVLLLKWFFKKVCRPSIDFMSFSPLDIKPWTQIFLRKYFPCLGLLLRWLRNNALELPRDPLVWLRRSASHTLNLLKDHLCDWIFCPFHLSEVLAKGCTTIQSYPESCLKSMLSWQWVLILVSFAVCSGEADSSQNHPVLITFSLTILPFTYFSLLTFCSKQQEEIKPPLQCFVWKSPWLCDQIHLLQVLLSMEEQARIFLNVLPIRNKGISSSSV